MRHYSSKLRADDPFALTDFETFYHEHAKSERGALNAGHKAELYGECVVDDEGDCGGSGWYYAFGSPGCLFDSEPMGPYDSEEAAVAAARESAGYCEHGVAEDETCDECPAPELWALQAPGQWVNGKFHCGGFLIYTTAPTLDYRGPVSCWGDKAAAERAALDLDLSGWTPYRLTDSEARSWGRGAE